MCKAREDGGLDNIDLRIFILALLGKWIWRLGSNKGGLWKEVIDSKYGIRETWESEVKIVRNRYDGKIWGRSEVWKVGVGISKKPSNGRWVLERKFCFWEDNWAGSGMLNSVFPRLFSLSLSKASAMVEFRAWNNGIWEWNFVWRRNLLNGKRI